MHAQAAISIRVPFERSTTSITQTSVRFLPTGRLCANGSAAHAPLHVSTHWDSCTACAICAPPQPRYSHKQRHAKWMGVCPRCRFLPQQPHRSVPRIHKARQASQRGCRDTRGGTSERGIRDELVHCRGRCPKVIMTVCIIRLLCPGSIVQRKKNHH